MNLASMNYLYRHPGLYDELGIETDDQTARQCENLIKEHGLPGAESLLDLGCGTGRHLAYLVDRFATCIGVDIQPTMIDYGRRVRPHLDLRVADMRHVRLGRTFDAICCLGYATAYLYTDDDLEATLATFAAHAHPGTVLILDVLAVPSSPGTVTTSSIKTNGRDAEVATTYEWNPRTRIATMRRQWQFNDGSATTDTVRRRVIEPPELRHHLIRAGFEPVAPITSCAQRITARFAAQAGAA